MMSQPFLSIITRCCQRPKMLSKNIGSVKAQTCHDLEQVFIVDKDRKGIQAADRALAENKDRVFGEYVYILDDDCMLTNNGFVEMVKDVVSVEHPDIVMVKSMRPPGPPSRQSIVPTANVWEGKMRHGSTNCLCYVMRAGLWKAHIEKFGVKPWGGDWWMLEGALKTNPAIHWLDKIVADARQLGRGKIFETTRGNWWNAVAAEHGIVNYPDEGWKLKLWKD